MSRFQLSLNVADVDAAVEFYTRLLAVAPVKHRPGYASFVVEDPPLKLIVIEDEGEPGSLNHVGIEHPDGAAVAAETKRVDGEGLAVHVDDEHTCCFATQQKAWSRDPDGVPWEIYTVVSDAEHFGANPHGGTPVDTILPPVDIEELRRALEDPEVVVIDAQGEGGFERAHLPGAVDVSLDDVISQAERMVGESSRRVVVYCTDLRCLGSEFVGTQLVEAGYTNVARFPGGVAEWREAGMPIETLEAHQTDERATTTQSG